MFIKISDQKGFAPILILIILATLIGGYVIYQRQNKPTPNSQLNTKTAVPSPSPAPDIKLDPSGKFKRYTNKIDKYSVNFPPDWNLAEHHPAYISNEPRSYAPDYLTIYLSPISQSGEDGKEFKSYIAITVNKANPRRLGEIDKAVKKFTQDYKSSAKKMTVSGQNAFQSNEGAGEIIQKGIATQFRYGIDTYGISIAEINQGFINKNLDVYNQLLSSFKFIAPPSQAVSNALKTYEYKDLGISFQIPGDWLVEKYNLQSLFVYDENDREIITMYTGGHTYNDACEKDPSKKTYKPYPLGAKTVNLDMTYACDPRVIRVKTSIGKEFNFEYRFPDIGQTDKEKDTQFLKTITGVEVIQ